RKAVIVAEQDGSRREARIEEREAVARRLVDIDIDVDEGEGLILNVGEPLRYPALVIAHAAEAGEAPLNRREIAGEIVLAPMPAIDRGRLGQALEGIEDVVGAREPRGLGERANDVGRGALENAALGGVAPDPLGHAQ